MCFFFNVVLVVWIRFAAGTVELKSCVLASCFFFRDFVRLCRSNGAKDYTSEQIFQHKIMILTREEAVKNIYSILKPGNISMNNKMNGQTFFPVFFFALSFSLLLLSLSFSWNNSDSQLSFTWYMLLYRIVVVFRFFARFPVNEQRHNEIVEWKQQCKEEKKKRHFASGEYKQPSNYWQISEWIFVCIASEWVEGGKKQKQNERHYVFRWSENGFCVWPDLCF